MPTFVATYDLQDTDPDPHSVVLEAADKRGWKVWIWGPTSGKWLRLPNTTLIGEFASVEAAFAAFDATISDAARAVGAINVEKVFVAQYGVAQFRSDVKSD